MMLGKKAIFGFNFLLCCKVFLFFQKGKNGRIFWGGSLSH